jgi:hypothetical protein
MHSRAERIRGDYTELKKQYDKLKQTQATQVSMGYLIDLGCIFTLTGFCL